jgi:hypothetical protein
MHGIIFGVTLVALLVAARHFSRAAPGSLGEQAKGTIDA